MRLNNLVKVSDRKNRKRIGRGDSSGHGKTSGRGHKGQKSRSGGSIRRGFEGGTMPYNRRLPKRGFFNKWRKKVASVNINSFKYLKTDKVDMDVLVEAGFVSGKRDCLKIIGKADLDKAYTVRADKFSEGAAESITKAGGKAEEIKLD